MKRILLSVVVLLMVQYVKAKDFIITEFGAKSDTTILSTKAIQSAIDRCAETGGRVIVPAGSYKSGTLYFKSGVSLNLEKGAILYGSGQLKDYPENQPDYLFFRNGSVKRALIYAEKCSGIVIEGEGTIDGRGACFWVPDGAKVDSYSVRPYLIWMIRCTNVRTEGVNLRNSGLWMQHYLACDQVYIHNINIFNHSNKNNDMMDIDGCHDVRITDCIGDSDDDGITFKSTSERANENIIVSNCILSSHCNALKMGTESVSGFRNFTISNIVIRPSVVTDHSIEGTPKGHTGIALETVDGGVLDGVIISNISIDGPVCPIFIRLGNRARPIVPEKKIEQIGILQNITITNVQAKNALSSCSITGIPGYPVRNITLRDIRVEFSGGGKNQFYDKVIPEKERSYPEFDMFDELPSFGWFVRHAENIRFENVQLITNQEDERPAMILSDVSDSGFQSMVLASSSKGRCTVRIEKSKEVIFSGNSTKGFSNCFVSLKGDENKKIMIVNNLLNYSKLAYQSETGVKTDITDSGNILKW